MRVMLLLSGITVWVSSLSAQATVPPDPIPSADSFSIVSRAVGERRVINVHLPIGYRVDNSDRFAVLYMPDGGMDEDFPHVVHTVDSLVALGKVPPLIIVGIPNTERRRDLTGPTRVKSDSAIAPHVGGSAAFRGFIRSELLPEIDRRYRTTSDRTVMGESLAGLFVVETLLRDPTLFTRFIAFDPSLWWDKERMVNPVNIPMAALVTGTRTLWTASSEEKGVSVPLARLVALLRIVPAKNLSVTYLPRKDLHHDNIFRTLAPQALVESFAH